MKFFKGNRTRIYGTGILILGVVQQYASDIIPDQYLGIVLAGVGIGVVILRELTNTAPGRSQ